MSIAPLTDSRIKREFLGWDSPALLKAARRIAESYCQGQILDLDHVTVVIPGRRAGRRLQELLAYQAEENGLLLTPPQVVTEERLPEMLYTPKRPFANDLVQDLAWAQALRELPDDKRRHIIPHAPETSDTRRWLLLGQVFRKLHVELAADTLDFAAVLENGAKLTDFTESERWDALALLQRRYHELLDGLQLWDKQTARLKAIGFNEIHTHSDIILLGTVDLNNALRRMLDQLAGRVTAFVIAPESLADRFDGHGCLIPSAWSEVEIPLLDEQLQQVEGPAEQGDAVSDWLAGLNGRFRVDQLAVGVPDQSLAPQIQRQLKQFGVDARWVEGIRLAETAPYRKLLAAVQFAHNRRYSHLAELVRHPDVESWLTPKPDDQCAATPSASLASQLDAFYNAHLPNTIEARTSLRNWPRLEAAVSSIDLWLVDASSPRPLRDWGKTFRGMLEAIYGSRTLDLEKEKDDALHEVLGEIVQVLDTLDLLPQSLDGLPLSGVEAFHLALGPLADQTLPPPANPNALEILGWLELPLDDSIAVILTSFNESFVPKSTGADAFLPDRLRCELGLEHDERRYARDAYAATVLCSSGKELRVLFARRDTQKDPLKPSRLIFACSDQTMVKRARRYFSERTQTDSPRRLLLATGDHIPKESRFRVPDLDLNHKARRKITVTEFKHYLACPYRYYLRYVCNLRAVNDSALELEGSAFGTLLHETLAAFGREESGPRYSNRPNEIFDFLADRLDELAKEKYGERQRRPALYLQLEQARRRLWAFAFEQAKEFGQGWRIVYAEHDGCDPLTALWNVGDQPVTLVGHIDRIDFHEATNRIRILDYKTANSARTPEATHRKKEAWIDLQLPLYRRLWSAAHEFDAVASVAMGFFNLPKNAEETKVVLAAWGEDALEDADRAADRVIRGIINSAFGMPTYPPPPYSEDFAAICLDSLHRKPELSDDAVGGAA